MQGVGILVVEDDQIIAWDLAERLKGLGCHVVGRAVSGEEAIRLASTLHPDVILMDIRLKGEMDGITAAQTIRTERDIPIVFLTGQADPATVRRVQLMGPTAYLLKPFSDQELREGIEAALARRGGGVLGEG